MYDPPGLGFFFKAEHFELKYFKECNGQTESDTQVNTKAIQETVGSEFLPKISILLRKTC